MQDVRSAVRTVGIEQGQTYAQLRSGGLDPRQLSKSFSRLQGYMDETNFDVDKARSEIFRSMYNVKKGDGMWWHNTDNVW